jgi:biopolymer transport protein ExbD
MSASMESSDAADPNLVPLLDVVLQLIMFFMITVNFVRVDQFDDSISLPVAQAAVPLDKTAEEWIFLNLDTNGKLVGNLLSFPLDTPGKLVAHLKRENVDLLRVWQQKNPGRNPDRDFKVVVVLRADKNCRYSQVWEVLDSCQRAGYRRWQLRVMTRSPV